jgi:hypothetical protein
MNTEVNRIGYEDLANNLASVLHRVVTEHAVVVVETEGGELAMLRALAPSEFPAKNEADYRAFRAAAGSWHDVDADALISDIYTHRDQPGRPPVSL